MLGYFAPYVQLQTPLRHSRTYLRATSTAVVEKLFTVRGAVVLAFSGG